MKSQDRPRPSASPDFVGHYPDPPAFAARWALDCRFTAAMDEATRSRKIAAWKHPVHRTLSGHEVASTASPSDSSAD